MHNSELNKGDLVPAIPPDDFDGGVGQWMVELQTRGLWDGEGFHGDEMIEQEVWWEILETCEGVRPGDCSVQCREVGTWVDHDEACRKAK